MARAHEIDAARTQKFFFRKHMAPPEVEETTSASSASTSSPCGDCSGLVVRTFYSFSKHPVQIYYVCLQGGLRVEDSFEEMTMDEIFNGKNCYYPGLIPLVYAYLDYISIDVETFAHINIYLEFISKLVPSRSYFY